MSDFIDHQQDLLAQLLQEGYAQQGDEFAGFGVPAMRFDELDPQNSHHAVQYNWYNLCQGRRIADSTHAEQFEFPVFEDSSVPPSFQPGLEREPVAVSAQLALEVSTSNIRYLDALEQTAAPQTVATPGPFFHAQHVETLPGSARPGEIDQAETQHPVAGLIPGYVSHMVPTSSTRSVLTGNDPAGMASMSMPDSGLEVLHPPSRNSSGRVNRTGELSARFVCDHPGCTRKEPFRRQYELKRHKGTHSVDKLDCPVNECSRKGPKGVRREDKLKEHVRCCHSVKDKFSCPVTHCSADAMSLDLLREHARRHTWYYRSPFNDGWGGLCDRSSRICPLEGCRKEAKDPSKLQEHLSQHDDRARMAQKTAVADAGYDPETVQIICPCCKVRVQDHRSFKLHLYGSHVPVDGPHAQQWLDEIRSGGWSIKDAPDGCFPEIAVEIPKDTTLGCAVCDFRVSIHRWSDRLMRIPRHKKIFLWSDELHLHREAILRLCPEFGDHPVFDDLQPTVQVKPENGFLEYL